MSPAARSKKYLESEGWHVEVVERWIPGANIRRDLWGFADLLAIKGAEILAVQVTSSSNVSARKKKITDHDLLPLVRKAGIGIVIHGWGKNASKRWVMREVDLS